MSLYDQASMIFSLIFVAVKLFLVVLMGPDVSTCSDFFSEIRICASHIPFEHTKTYLSKAVVIA